MPLNKAVLAAFKAASRLKPDIKQTYEAQRVAEDVMGKLSLPDPRCRIDRSSRRHARRLRSALAGVHPARFRLLARPRAQGRRGLRGTILFFHGGGWANGSVDLYIDACSTLAVKLERRVVSVDYRRSPEHRFPQAPEDCYETARQLFAGELLADVDVDNIVLFGDSAGGNLAAVVSLMARDRGEYMPRSQMLLYPVTYNDHDPRTSWFDSVRENGEDYLLTARDVQGYMELYCSSPEDLANPYLAPLLAPDVSNQPRTLVITAEYCPLRDEGEAFAARIDLESGEAACYRVLDAVHGYLLYPSVLNVVKDTYRIMKHFLDGDGLEQEDDPGVARATWYRLDNVGKFYSSQAGSSAQTVFYDTPPTLWMTSTPTCCSAHSRRRSTRFPASTCVYAAACSGTIWNRPPKCRP